VRETVLLPEPKEAQHKIPVLDFVLGFFRWQVAGFPNAFSQCRREDAEENSPVLSFSFD
jgi:hypothetical protein